MQHLIDLWMFLDLGRASRNILKEFLSFNRHTR